MYIHIVNNHILSVIGAVDGGTYVCNSAMNIFDYTAFGGCNIGMGVCLVRAPQIMGHRPKGWGVHIR